MTIKHNNIELRKGKPMSEGLYTQVKVSVCPSIAAGFKAGCMASGRSMAQVLSEFMASYPSMAVKRVKPTIAVENRQQRRKAVEYAISLLESVRDKEDEYHDNFPENLEGSPLHEASADCVAALEEVIDQLSGVYD